MVSELAPLSLTQILRRRPQWVLAAILAMTSIGIVLQPGFGRLNYYFALSTALVVPLLVGFAVIQAVGQLGRAAASSPPLWALFRVSGALTAVYLTIPLLAAGLAAIWVRNCAPFRGVLFYLFETGLGTLVAS
ncbi:MAG: hypothetical protein KDA21_00145, partial [Phycisphaerales bacterium]|nr:hypothetical protein [Phycisphaerales bacterium]